MTTSDLTLQDEAGTSGDPAVDEPSYAARQVRDFLLVLMTALALVTAGAVGYSLAGRDDGGVPASDSAEAGFARDMSTHHAQAVQMSLLVRDATTDPDVRYLAYDVATGQQAQLGMMTGWLSDWGLSQSGDQPRMAWMTGAHGDGHSGGHDGDLPTGSMAGMQLLPDGRMPGMATAADIARLGTLRGQDAEVAYLQMLVRHHEGGVAMAQAGVELVERPAERTLAQSIFTSQTSEIALMQDMLRQRGATPE